MEANITDYNYKSITNMFINCTLGMNTTRVGEGLFLSCSQGTGEGIQPSQE